MMTLIVVFFILLFLVLIMNFYRRDTVYYYDNGADEDVITSTTVTTTTTTDNTPQHQTVGTLTRQWQHGRPYVIDPVDNMEIFLSTTDDMYEDAAGKIWNLD